MPAPSRLEPHQPAAREEKVMTTAREDGGDRTALRMLAPGFGIDKSRLHGSGFRSKGFAITDLLGLEADIQSSRPPAAPGCGGR